MADQDNSSTPLKVFLWASPRSASTTFLKCMTFVPDAIAWHEPYTQMGKFSLDENQNSPIQPYVKELLEKHGGKAAIEKIEGGYDASDKHLGWLKDQLEGDFPGKKLVFVKELGAIYGNFESMRDKIPSGFRHTFLIRNPSKLLASFVKLLNSGSKFFMNEKSPMSSYNPANITPLQDLNAVWKLVKYVGLETRPIIIDAEDLFENPKGILEAYCNELGIPFSDDLLTWEAGDDVMTKHWMVPKQTILTFRTLGFHGSTFSCTGFKKPEASSVDMSDVQQHVQPTAEQLQWAEGFIKREMPFYKELYDERLKLLDSK